MTTYHPLLKSYFYVSIHSMKLIFEVKFVFHVLIYYLQTIE